MRACLFFDATEGPADLACLRSSILTNFRFFLLDNERIKTAVQWATAEGDEYESGYRIIITHFKSIKQVTWHGKGDYFATVMPDGANRSALIHQLSKRRTQIPFSKSKGLIQCVLFHPVKPCFFVAVSFS